MKKAAYDMLYLSTCAVNIIKPDWDYIAHMNLEKLFQMCQFHSLTAIVCMALESVGIKDKNFIEAKSKAIRKNILLDAEREKICEFLDQNGIWHMPLKGVLLKEFYPKIGMRQMADNDILYDRVYQKQVFEFMRKCGYTAESVGKTNHDTYMKPPVYNFEMHTELFGRKYDEGTYSYYSEIKNHLVQDAKKLSLYHFTDEDFYVYMTAHEYKHYSHCGTGLRSLLDCFIFLKEKGNSLNWNYIAQQTEILGISEFEKKSRRLSMKIFTNPDCGELSAEENEMLKFYLFSGAYGTQTNLIMSRIKDMEVGNKKLYLLRRIFPDMKFWRKHFPTAAKYPFLIPFVWCFRLIRGLTVRRKKCAREFNIILNTDEKEFLS